jgi:two-component system response regulator PilR (NtrC family)
LTAESLPAIVATASARQKSGLSVELPEKGLALDEVLGRLEKDLLVKALERTGGVKRKAADILQVSFRSFRYRLAKYGLGDGGNSLDDE